METELLFEAKRLLQTRIARLKSNAARAFHPLNDLEPATLPVLMYAFATADYFSSLWAGWYDRSRKPASDPRTSTRRIADFLETYLLYPQKESRLSIAVWRHHLVHHGESGELRDEKKSYAWQVVERSPHHWTLENVGPDSYLLRLGAQNFIEDLDDGVFAPGGYFEDLRLDREIQERWRACRQEMLSRSFRFEN